MSILLHLETSTKACSVALSRSGSLIALKESVDDEYAHGEKLTLYIQHVLNESGIAMNELNAVSVASGPGSYTGLRIGVSTAKGLCYALGIPLISVNSLVSLATIGKEKHPEKSRPQRQGKTCCKACKKSGFEENGHRSKEGASSEKNGEESCAREEVGTGKETRCREEVGTGEEARARKEADRVQKSDACQNRQAGGQACRKEGG